MDTHTYGTTRVWERTLQTLRFIHAITGESIVAILVRLAKQELERRQKEQREKLYVSPLPYAQANRNVAVDA